MLELFFSAIIITVTNLYILSKLAQTKLNFKSYRLYFGSLFMVLGLMLNFLLIDKLIQALMVIVIVVTTVLIIFGFDFKKALVLSITDQLLYIFCEVLMIIIVLIITNVQNKSELVEIFSGTIWANITISFCVFMMVQFSFVKKVYEKINYLVKNQRNYNIIMAILMFLLTASVLFNLIYYTNNLILLSLIGIIVLLFYLVFIVKSAMVHNSYLSMYVKYNSTLETLKSYESILDKYKVSNHENKNQLLTIRNMIKKNESDIMGFIDKLVDNKYKDDENLIIETSKIPSGGLRALVYSKLLYMKNNNVNFMLKIDRKIRSFQLIELDENIILDICKIIGVFLDNAIEETKRIKNGDVGIEMYMTNNELNISISNIFDGKIDLERLDEIKYTTKGEGHGYGLALVKEILNKNGKLKNIRMVNDNVFVQILKVNIPSGGD